MGEKGWWWGGGSGRHDINGDFEGPGLATLATSQAKRIGASVLLLQAGVTLEYTTKNLDCESSDWWLATTAAGI